MKTENNLRKSIIDYGKKLVSSHLIQATWGNISVRLDDEYFLITPSGIDYFDIEIEDIVKVKISDYTYLGKNKPSSERKMHALMYQKRSDVQAIVHTHSSNLQIFASCRLPLKRNEQVVFPCCQYAVSSTMALAKKVVRVIDNYDGVIVANHGFVAVADSIEQAFYVAEHAEKEAGKLLDD